MRGAGRPRVMWPKRQAHKILLIKSTYVNYAGPTWLIRPVRALPSSRWFIISDYALSSVPPFDARVPSSSPAPGRFRRLGAWISFLSITAVERRTLPPRYSSSVASLL